MKNHHHLFHNLDNLPGKGRNTFRFGEENCTVWYDSTSGKIIAIGPIMPKVRKNLYSIQLMCDSAGVLPQIYSPGRTHDVSSALLQVLEVVRNYRHSLNNGKT